LPPRPPAPPSPVIPATMTVMAQYLNAFVVFQGSSPYSWCDAPAQDDLVTQLAAALNLARDNITAICKGEPGSTQADTFPGNRRLLQGDDSQGNGEPTPACGSDGGSLYEVNIRVDPTILMYDFKAKVHAAMTQSLSGICPLGGIDGSWAQTGYVMTNSGAAASGEKEKSSKSSAVRKTVPIVVVVVGVGLIGLVLGVSAYVYKRRKSGSLYQSGDSGSVIEEQTIAGNNNGATDKSLVITNGIFATNSGGSTGTAVPGSTGR
ncbi:hypothetical protein Vretifemale_12751, partial [Volvox reticuliferus]